MIGPSQPEVTPYLRRNLVAIARDLRRWGILVKMTTLLLERSFELESLGRRELARQTLVMLILDKRVATPLGVSLGAVKNSRGVATHHNTLPEENPFRLLTLYY